MAGALILVALGSHWGLKLLWLGSTALARDVPEGWQTGNWVVLNSVTIGLAAGGLGVGAALRGSWGLRLPAPLGVRQHAGTLPPQIEARSLRCDQVLYTVERDGHRYIDERGTVNLFMLTRDGRPVTPPLGTALDGVTRDSIM